MLFSVIKRVSVSRSRLTVRCSINFKPMEPGAHGSQGCLMPTHFGPPMALVPSSRVQTRDTHGATYSGLPVWGANVIDSNLVDLN